MNILLTSIGRRTYLVQYFKDALNGRGKVHVANSTARTPAFLCADESTVTPLIYDGAYIPFLLDYCVRHQIAAIVPLFDIDLPVLATNRKLFRDIGVRLIVSDKNVINVCNDKWETYSFLSSNGFDAPRTYLTIESALEAIRVGDLQYPVMVKPRWGMGSIAIFDAYNEQELMVLYNKAVSKIMDSYLRYESEVDQGKCVLVQEVLKGQEYGLDVINNLRCEYQNTVVKLKHAMRAGETDCAETVANHKLKVLGKALSKRMRHIANLDVDVFLEKDKACIVDLNARFGGGYPFSHIAGVNLPLAIVKWLRALNVDNSLLKERIGVVAHKDIGVVNIPGAYIGG